MIIMRLKRFIGKDIRGYMNLDIIFKENVTFLIGINGSGKTTVLKLLAGLLTPSYTDLTEIEFSEITLFCLKHSEGNDEIQISCKKRDSYLFLTYNDNKNPPIEDKVLLFEHSPLRKRYHRRGGEMEDEKLERVLLEFEDLNPVQKIKELNSPLFLGLNRRIINSHSSENFEREIFFWRKRREDLNSELDIVDNALRDIQDIVFSHIRQNAKKQTTYSDDFRKRVIQDSFSFFKKPVGVSEDYKKEREKLKCKKEELTKATSGLVINDISEPLESLFKELSGTLETLSSIASTENGKISGEYYETLMKWLVNSAQLERIDKLILYGNQYADNITKLKEPITRFTESVNLFFKEGGKEILIDGQGEIKVKINAMGKTKINTIYELSSGEKQLVVMMAHLSFYKLSRMAPIFVIDEPELSLHISWQEIFVDALLKASPNTQFILATHAPAILAKKEREEWCVDLSREIYL